MSKIKLPLAERLKMVQGGSTKIEDFASYIEKAGVITTKLGFLNGVSSASGITLEAVLDNDPIVARIRKILSMYILVSNPVCVFTQEMKNGNLEDMPESMVQTLAVEADILSDLWVGNREIELMTILENLIQAYVKAGKAERAREGSNEQIRG